MGLIVLVRHLRRHKGGVQKGFQWLLMVRLIGFFAVCVVLHVIAWLGAPYLYIPTRFFMYSLPFLITLNISLVAIHFAGPSSAAALISQTQSFNLSGNPLVYLMAFGGRGNVEFAASPEQQLSQPLADAITALPKDILIAGWPAAEIRNVEYVTRRNAFLPRRRTKCCT